MRLGALADKLHGQLSRVTRALLDWLNARFEQYAENTAFKAATYLDPLWKLDVMTKAASARRLVRVIQQCVKRMCFWSSLFLCRLTLLQEFEYFLFVLFFGNFINAISIGTVYS